MANPCKPVLLFVFLLALGVYTCPRLPKWFRYLRPHAAALKVAHPLMLRAIAPAKKKDDRIDAKKISDCLRCDFLPGCYMAPTAFRERRHTLRHRNLLVRQILQMACNQMGLETDSCHFT